MLYYNIYPEYDTIKNDNNPVRNSTSFWCPPRLAAFWKAITQGHATADRNWVETKPPGPFQSFFCFSSAAIFNVSLTKLLSLSLRDPFPWKGVCAIQPLIPWHRRCLSTSFTRFFRLPNECPSGGMRKRRGRKSEAEKRMQEDGRWW